jgi:predicted Zn-dependent protease
MPFGLQGNADTAESGAASRSAVQNLSRRKSRRLDPDQPTDAAYTTLPALEPLRRVWPAILPTGVRDWLAMHPYDGIVDDLAWFTKHLEGAPVPEVFIRFPEAMLEDTKAQLANFCGVALGVAVKWDDPNPSLDMSSIRSRGGPFGKQLHADDMLEHSSSPNGTAQRWPQGRWRIFVIMTDHDLYMDGFKFLFGLSSPYRAKCVLSTRRWTDACEGWPALRGIAHTLVHEAGHCLKLQHCTLNRCLMNGHNSMDEAERSPCDFCPQCLAKIVTLTGVVPAHRFRALAQATAAMGGVEDAAQLGAYAALLE